MAAGAASAKALCASADTALGFDPEGLVPARPVFGSARPQPGAEAWIRGLKRCPVTMARESAGDLPSKSQWAGKTIRWECGVGLNFKVVVEDDERTLPMQRRPLRAAARLRPTSQPSTTAGGGGGLNAPVQNPYRLRRAADAARTS
jgi:hypothetical protein